MVGHDGPLHALFVWTNWAKGLEQGQLSTAKGSSGRVEGTEAEAASTNVKTEGEKYSTWKGGSGGRLYGTSVPLLTLFQKTQNPNKATK